MAMNYLDLIAPRTTAGSIHSFVNYKKTPVDVVLEEAQTLVFSLLRVREMKASALLSLPQGGFNVALPDRFLEPIALRDREGISLIPNVGERERFVGEAQLTEKRVYDADAYTTLDGTITAGATALVVDDADEFPDDAPFPIVIDSEQMLVTAGAGTTSWTVTRGFGGTTAAAHSDGATVDGALQSGIPGFVAVFDERYQFDCWATQARKYDHVFYQRPALLAPSNLTNFLTSRYPHILRVACQARAASFMKDAEEFQARQAELFALIQAANAESDMGRAT